MTQARLCPSCKKLNSASENVCNYCGKSLNLRPRGEASFSAPLAATKFLVGLCIVNFAMLVLINGSLPLGFLGPWARTDAIIGAGGIAGRFAQVQPWRLLSANFVHLGFLHLGLNLYALLSFGRVFEERFGGARMILVYAVTGISGFFLSSLLYGENGPATAGASAALYGLIGVEIATLVGRKDPQAKEAFFQYLFVAIALAIIVPVNNFAHLGGFLAGLPCGFLLNRERDASRRDRLMGGLAGAVIAASVVSIALCLATLFALREMVT